MTAAVLAACGSTASVATVTTHPVVVSSPSLESWAVSKPARLAIPSLAVDAPVEEVGLDAQGRIATPSVASNVGWYRLGPVPGQQGQAIIAGHLDWTDGPAVFWHLDRLRIGDEVEVRGTDGSRRRFGVDSVGSVSYDARIDASFGGGGGASLALITCTGSWDRQRQVYLQRLVVHTSLLGPAPAARPGDAG